MKMKWDFHYLLEHPVTLFTPNQLIDWSICMIYWYIYLKTVRQTDRQTKRLSNANTRRIRTMSDILENVWNANIRYDDDDDDDDDNGADDDNYDDCIVRDGWQCRRLLSKIWFDLIEWRRNPTQINKTLFFAGKGSEWIPSLLPLTDRVVCSSHVLPYERNREIKSSFNLKIKSKLL